MDGERGRLPTPWAVERDRRDSPAPPSLETSGHDQFPVQGQRRSMAATDQYRLVPRRLDHDLERWLCGEAGSECLVGTIGAPWPIKVMQ